MYLASTVTLCTKEASRIEAAGYILMYFPKPLGGQGNKK